MSFTSFHFLAFFPIVTGLYFVIPHRWRWALLVVASYYFYMSWRPWYSLLLLFATALSYVCGLAMERTSERQRLYWLIGGVTINLAVLFFFKYFDFFNVQTRDLMALAGVDYRVPNLDLVLPVAISFHTFQVLSYLFDVYRRDIQAERHFGIFALYVVYYPQLVAGPIERAFHFLPQLRLLLTPTAPKQLQFDETRVISGLRLVLCGFAKKILIADNLGLYVDQVYDAPANASGASLAIATLGFAFQIFYDFSAYTDIARGCSRVMGLELIENFRRPYLARSIADFWKRWHISLTSWFRDYVYFPMGGNRVFFGRWIVNVFTVFVLSGLWHGANWTFIVWGALHALYYLISRITERLRATIAKTTGIVSFPALHIAWQISTTFVLVCFAWIFFRAPDLSTALLIVDKIVRWPIQKAMSGLAAVHLMTPAADTIHLLGTKVFDTPRFHYTILWLALFSIWLALEEFNRLKFSDLARWQRWVAYYGACITIIIFGNFGTRQFIYFQF